MVGTGTECWMRRRLRKPRRVKCGAIFAVTAIFPAERNYVATSDCDMEKRSLDNLDKLPRKPPGKCVYVDGQWYTPSEVESLGGKKARKWRQSVFHTGKPLVDYDLTCVEQSGVGDTLPHDNDVDTPPCSVLLLSVCQGLASMSPCIVDHLPSKG